MSTVNEHLGPSIHVDQVNTVVEVPRAERMKCIKASTYIYIYITPALGEGRLDIYNVAFQGIVCMTQELRGWFWNGMSILGFFPWKANLAELEFCVNRIFFSSFLHLVPSQPPTRLLLTRIYVHHDT
jgi:hypothetical protein